MTAAKETNSMRFYRFELKEMADLCQDQDKIALLYEIAIRIMNQSSMRTRTKEERARRAEFYELDIKDVI